MVRVWKFGDDVDTDQIVPGRYAPYMLKADQDVKDFVFIEARPAFARAARPGDIIVAWDNFGCGSSREYAPFALKRQEIGAIIANSFARIFFRNTVNLGIPLFVAPEVVTAVHDGALAELNVTTGQLTVNGETYELPPLPDFAREIREAGGIVAYVRANGLFPGEAA